MVKKRTLAKLPTIISTIANQTKDHANHAKKIICDAIFDLEKELHRLKLQEKCSHKIWSDIRHETTHLDSHKCRRCGFVYYIKPEKT